MMCSFPAFAGVSFNSRSREGATLGATRVRLTKLSFNSRSREGATPRVAYNSPNFRFNSRSREGATSAGFQTRLNCEFQFTLP